VVDYQFKVGQVLFTLGRNHESIAQFEHVLSMDRGHVDAASLIARQWYYLGEDARAWEYVHLVEALGGEVPPQFRVLLAARTPEP
jgi:hypothetical protein